jgi:hypothetical protein
MASPKTLVFTIALNGYQYLYSNNLSNQFFYAKNNGYSYVAVTKPALTLMAMECAWLKISLIANALRAGYETVMYIDADADIKLSTPPLQTLIEPNKYLYMAHGYSGRFNSGVIIAKNHPDLIEWLEVLIANSERQIPSEDSVGWGENGHVIHYAKNLSFIRRLSTEWNNNCNPNLNDYIRHYSMGPLRNFYVSSLYDRMVFFGFRCTMAILKRMKLTSCHNNFKKGLLDLTKKCITYYPQFQ